MTDQFDFKRVRVLVVGDIILDRYWWGRVKRISPEAPVPIVDLVKKTFAPGGAANVAANVAGLGAECVLIGCVGDDEEGSRLKELLLERNISPNNLVTDPGRPTIVKTRIIAHNQQVVRVDQEMRTPFSPNQYSDMWSLIEKALKRSDAVVISDYAKGLLTDELLLRLIDSATEQGMPVIVDPKGKDYTRYRGCSLITPNLREAAEACNLDDNLSDIAAVAGKRLLRNFGFQAVLITRSEEGMTLFRADNEPFHLPATAQEVYDVTGAGDTVVACLGTGLGAGLDLESASALANVAAGVVVRQVGTTAINIAALTTVANPPAVK